MRVAVLSFLGIVRAVVDLFMGFYFLYLTYLAFAGGTAWLTNIEFSGSFLTGLLWLLIVAPISITIFDFILNITLVSVVAPIILLFDRSEKLEQAAAAEITYVESDNKPVYIGFGGWLYFYAIGLIISFGSSAFYIVDTLLPLLNDESFKNMLLVDSNWGIIILLELIYNCGLLIFIFIIGYFCIKMRRSFVKYSIIFMVFLIISQITMYISYLSVPETAEYSGDTLNNILRSIIYSCIWIPYMLKSKRVKNTYVL